MPLVEEESALIEEDQEHAQTEEEHSQTEDEETTQTDRESTFPLSYIVERPTYNPRPAPEELPPWGSSMQQEWPPGQTMDSTRDSSHLGGD